MCWPPTALSLDAVCSGKTRPIPGVMGARQNSSMIWQGLDTSHVLPAQHSCFEVVQPLLGKDQQRGQRERLEGCGVSACGRSYGMEHRKSRICHPGIHRPESTCLSCIRSRGMGAKPCNRSGSISLKALCQLDSLEPS